MPSYENAPGWGKVGRWRVSVTRRGSRVIGDKKMPADRMTQHWVHHSGGRMYWCNCMPGFRVGSRVHYPRKGVGIKPLRTVLTPVIYHEDKL